MITTIVSAVMKTIIDKFIWERTVANLRKGMFSTSNFIQRLNRVTKMLDNNTWQREECDRKD